VVGEITTYILRLLEVVIFFHGSR